MPELEMKINRNLRQQIHAAAVEAVTEVFEQEILPAAKALSPVGVPPDDKHPGRNRDSIRVRIKEDPEKGRVDAYIYTESGYGWLLEHGTSHQRGLLGRFAKRKGREAEGAATPARPYIYPAMLRFVRSIPDRLREILAGDQNDAAA
jgi:hypothetical protein